MTIPKTPQYSKIRRFSRQKWVRTVLWSIGILIALLLVAAVSVAIYIERNKKDVLEMVTRKLNENLDGTLVIGDLKPEFFSGFPRVSLRLLNVSLRDRRFPEHKHQLLSASKIDVSVNLFALAAGTVEIGKISIDGGSVDVFVMADGYSNTSVFKKRKSSDKKSGSALEFEKFRITDLKFRLENQKSRKLHEYEVVKFIGEIEAEEQGWKSEIDYEILAHDMAFNQDRGSFIRGKRLVGKFEIGYDGLSRYQVYNQPMKIGKENFEVGAEFDFSDGKSTFAIHLKNKKILWKNAIRLLSENITKRLEMFDMLRPIEVRCDLAGNFDVAGDPLIYVQATVRDNELNTPSGTVYKCNFDGIFANNYDKKKVLGDANSVILFRNFTGEYGQVPFAMPVLSIVNLEKPKASGKFSSGFELSRANSLLDKNVLNFKGGRADIAVDFTAEVINQELAKPKIVGKIAISNADMIFGAKKINLNDVSVNLDFNPDNLYIRNIHIKTPNSDVVMDGKIENFLNLYYDSPEKLVLNWNVYSKKLDVKEFASMLDKRPNQKKLRKRKGNFTAEIDEFMQNSQMRMAMKIDKLRYGKFSGNNATAIVDVSESGIEVRKVVLGHSGGQMRINGRISHAGTHEKYAMSVSANRVNIREFFAAFDNFGMETLKSENLSGKLSLDAQLAGHLTTDQKLLPKTISGKVAFSLKDGALLNFEPIRRVGRIAFRRRDVQNIAFQDLKGEFVIEGEKVQVSPMKINSNVLNLDVSGVYSFGKGTVLKVDVPLRNPEKDALIEDETEREKRRHRGIVLHLLAADDPETGKVKISLTGKNQEEEN